MRLKQLPSAEFTGTGAHDPFPALPEGVPLKVKVKIDAAEGRVEIDLRDNIDCVPCGLNESKTCAINNTVTGAFQFDRSGRAAQRRQLPPRQRAAARKLRGGNPALSDLVLGRDHQYRRPAGQYHAGCVRPVGRGLWTRRGRPWHGPGVRSDLGRRFSPRRRAVRQPAFHQRQRRPRHAAQSTDGSTTACRWSRD